MTSYKGIIKITCTRKTGCIRNVKINDMQPGCMDCPAAISQILDLDEKVIFEYRSPKERTGERVGKDVEAIKGLIFNESNR